MKLKPLAIALSIAYIASIWLAVVAIDRFGVVQILETGLYAPAAVYVVGATLVIRDFLQDALQSRAGMVALIIVGALVSAFVNPHLAIASGVAFLIAESLDYLIYTPLRARAGRVAGIVFSNAVSIPVDSLIFLSLAFGSLEFFAGQVVGKSIATLLAIGLLGAYAVVRVDKRPVTA